jgi:hypothetical protein
MQEPVGLVANMSPPAPLCGWGALLCWGRKTGSSTAVSIESRCDGPFVHDRPELAYALLKGVIEVVHD